MTEPGASAPASPTSPASSAALAALVLDEEARRHAAATPERREYGDDDLMVVGEDVTLADAFRQGGVSLLVALMAVAVLQSLDNAALAVLAPDIQDSLGVSSAVLGAIGGAAGVLFVMGAIPIAALADHRRRTTIAGVCTFAYGLLSITTAAVGNAFWLFAARMGSGLASSHILPVHNSLLADAYPIRARGRIYSIYGLGTPIGQLLGPVTVGAVAALAGGLEGWRWAFVAVGIPALGLSVFVATRREPARGMNEQVAVLGETIEAERSPIPTSTSMAFARLRQIRTFRFMLVGIGALGFGLFSVPIFLSVFMEDTFGLSAFERGVVGSIVVVPSLLVLPFVGGLNDRLFRGSPPRSLVLCAGLISLFGVFVTVALAMPNEATFVAALALATTCANAGFMLIGPIVAAVVPYRLRTQGYAMVGVYIFLSGAFLGAVLAGLMSDAWGVRTALSLLCIPSSLVGGALLAGGAAHIRGDIGSVMEELEEERAEAVRVREQEGADQVLQVRHLDFSYGTVQVLFDVDLDVHRGEVLALLGTNGAGKSTLLRCICGLGVPSRGTVRLHGHTVTYAEPEQRVRLGIVMMPGGDALWEPLSVEDNLRLGAFVLRHDDRERQRRLDRVLGLFPELRDLRDRPAGTLSGGQKQMVALAKAMLLEPEVLLIDELSLGLSPIATQQVLAKVEQLRDEGLTIVIVEQSVNVALSIADRAVFMEKGQVRFDGPAAELLERGDLLRAVFLGGEA
jgi:ABC-type branched-subunit amino acid transport system ATPase component/MFS family permease